jgi:hypothetical protein
VDPVDPRQQHRQPLALAVRDPVARNAELARLVGAKQPVLRLGQGHEPLYFRHGQKLAATESPVSSGATSVDFR